MNSEPNKKEAIEFVEKQIKLLLEDNILSQVSWLCGVAPLADLRDVAIGYVVGVIELKIQLCSELIGEGDEKSSLENRRLMMNKLQEKLPEIIAKIEQDFCKWEPYFAISHTPLSSGKIEKIGKL